MLRPCRNLHEVFLSYEFAADPTNLPFVPHQYFFTTRERTNIFNQLNIALNDYKSLLQYFSNNPEDTIRLLDDMILSPKVIKILDHQMTITDLDFIFQLPDTKFVLLDRTNKLDQFVSYETAKKSKQWANTDTSAVKIHVDKDEFFKFTEESYMWYENIKQRLISNGHDFLELNYENDLNCESLNPVMNRIKKWLSLQGIETSVGYTTSRYKKQNTLPMSEKILNFDEIADLIK
jgi:hypothetical protein